LTERIKQLKLEIAEHEAEQKKLESQNLELNHDYKQALKKIAELSSASDADRDQIAKLKSSNVDYQQKLNTAHEELRVSQSNMEVIKDKMFKARNLLKALTKQRDDVVAIADRYKNALDQFSKDHGADSTKLQNVQKVLGHLRSRVRDLNKKLERAEAVRKNLSSLLREHKNIITGLTKLLRKRPTQDQFDELNKALKASRETIKALKTKLKQLADSKDDNGSTDSDDSYDRDDSTGNSDSSESSVGKNSSAGRSHDAPSDQDDSSGYDDSTGNDDSNEKSGSQGNSKEKRNSHRSRHESDRVEINIHALEQLATRNSHF
jgi:chromosome segregation ATPase